MAKENTVYLYGYVGNNPILKINSEGRYCKGQLNVAAVRRSYMKNMLLLGIPRYDNIIVYSRNEEFIKNSMCHVTSGDMVLIKGTLCTMETPKRFLCPYCNYEVIRNGVSVYIDPIYIKRCESNISREDAKEILDNADEISNIVKIMGTLCRDVDYYIDPDTNKPECDFQIASNRNRRIIEDNPEKRTDYPWVKTYGPMATESVGALHINSTIYIDGAIQTRKFVKEFICESCGEIFKREDRAMEIVPYHIEYLEDCDIPESERGFEGDGE